MRGLSLFVGGLLVGLAVQATVAQGSRQPSRLNHVAIAVPDVAAAYAWYRDKMGFNEVMHQQNAEGKMTSIYVQISRDTFIEIQEANAQRPAGLNHFGLEVPNIKQAVANYRGKGITSTDPADKPSAYSGGYLANLTDLNGQRIELSEQPAEGKLRKAAEAWKE